MHVLLFWSHAQAVSVVGCETVEGAGPFKAVPCHITHPGRVRGTRMNAWARYPQGWYEIGTGPAEAACGGIPMETVYSPPDSTMLWSSVICCYCTWIYWFWCLCLSQFTPLFSFLWPFPWLSSPNRKQQDQPSRLFIFPSPLGRTKFGKLSG